MTRNRLEGRAMPRIVGKTSHYEAWFVVKIQSEVDDKPACVAAVNSEAARLSNCCERG